MVKLSISRLNDEKSELSNDVRAVRSILKVGGHGARQAFPKTVRFALQEPDPAGQERSSGAASGHKTSNNRKRVSTMRSAHDTQPLSDSVSNGKVSPRSDAVHTTVPEAAVRHKSNDGTVSSRTVTRYNGNSPEATLERPIEQTPPNILERDSMPVDAGHDIFVAHRWSKPDKPASDKRKRTPRNVTNASVLGNVYKATETDASESDVFPAKDKEGDQGEVAPRRTSKP